MSHQDHTPQLPPSHLPVYPRKVGRVVEMTDEEVQACIPEDSGAYVGRNSWDMDGPHDGNEDPRDDDDVKRPQISESLSDVYSMFANTVATLAMLMAILEGKKRRHEIYKVAGNGDPIKRSGVSRRGQRAAHTAQILGLA